MLQPRLGDMLSDLPTISSFGYTERASYRSAANTPYQQFLRRRPSPHEPSSAERALEADRRMGACKEEERNLLKQASASSIEQVRICNQ